MLLTVRWPDPAKLLEEQEDDVALAALAWAEARGEIRVAGYDALLAVMNVARNRSRREGKSIKQVIFASAVARGRRIWQFSCWSREDPRTPAAEPTDPNYTSLLTLRAESLARGKLYQVAWVLAAGVLGGILDRDPTKGATHYYNPSVVKPPWGRGHPLWRETAVIGNHVFGVAP